VDLVLLDSKKFKLQWGVEIKWSYRYFEKAEQLKSLLTFCKENKLSSALITTIDVQGGIGLTFLTASIYIYNTGNQTLKKENES